MKTLHLFLILSLTFATLATGQAPPPPNTPAPPPAAPVKRSAAELEKLVAPIALYPDSLIATLLPAAVYPLEIVQAARFVANTNNLPNLDAQSWDANVKAVARVPAVIQKMNDELQWTMDLGDAFLAQDKEVMDTIQALRGKAQKAGTLQTTPQQVVVVTNMVVQTTVEQKVVVVTNTVVQIQPSNPEVVYVPTYNPYTVYYPPPAYVYDPFAPLMTFGVGMAVGAIIANNNCDWHGGGCYHGDVDINVNRNVNNNFNRNSNVNTGRAAAGQTSAQKKWQPDSSRLSKSGSPATANSARSAQARGWSSPGGAPSTGMSGARPSTGTAGTRPSAGTAGARPSTGTPSARPSTGTASANRPSPASNPSRPNPSPSASPSKSGASGSAFGGVNGGSGANGYSNRGASSRSSGGGFSGGRSGGGGGGRGGGRR